MNFLRLLILIPVILWCAPANAVHPVAFTREIFVPEPAWVAVDAGGSIFATRNGTEAVLLRKDGSTEKGFKGIDPKGREVPKKPRGIFPAANFLYVSDASRDCILVFSYDGVLKDVIGSGGSGPKEFSYPSGIFVRDGLLFVADTGNDRVQIVDVSGVYLRSIGTTGVEDARLDSPSGVVVTHDGSIYVVDGGKRGVKIFSRDGQYRGKLDGVLKPVAIAAAEDGGLFVVDGERGAILKYTAAGTLDYSFGSVGSGKVQFLEPSGLAALPDGSIFVSDRERNGIQVVATEPVTPVAQIDRIPPPTHVRRVGEIRGVIGKLSWDPVKKRLLAADPDSRKVSIMSNGAVASTIPLPERKPVAAAADRLGNIWVIDRKRDTLIRIDGSGKTTHEIGGSGSREGYFQDHADVVVAADGTVFVADTGNGRIQYFTPEGVFLGAIGAGELKKPVALDLSPRGELYLLDASLRSVLVFSADGRFLRRWGGNPDQPGAVAEPVDLAVTGDEVMVLDGATDDVKVFTPGGRYLRTFGAAGRGKGDFRKATSVAAGDDDAFFVADGGNERIQELAVVPTPAPPGHLRAVAGMRSVELTWDRSNESHLASYRIFRSLREKENFSVIATMTEPSFVDDKVEPGTSYFYRVAAVSRSGAETVSPPAHAVPLVFRPAKPAGIQARSSEWSVTLSWNDKPGPYFDRYIVYRQEGEDLVEVGETREPRFTDAGLDPETIYSYEVSAVSIDDEESDGAEAEIKTLRATRPPIEITAVSIRNIFSNAYKVYESEGIGSIRVTNNTAEAITSLRLSFSIREFMDFPAEVEIRDLPPHEGREVTVKAVFNNRVLDVTEDTPLQGEIRVAYFINEKPRVFTKSHSLTLFEKHRMLWDEKERIATFITPKDPVVVDFTRSVVTQYGEIGSPLVFAGALFDALGARGMTYLTHPANPYQVTRGATDLVDYVQYPRETLERNSGVCTDLVVLFATALEGLGIRTTILGVPGHLLMMFAIGTAEELGNDPMNGMLVIRDGYVWVPVETTLVGSSFLKAWEAGSRTYQEWRERGIENIDPRTSWEKFKPATLPRSDWRPVVVTRAEIDEKFSHEMQRLNVLRLKYQSRKYAQQLEKNPTDTTALLQLGIIFGEEGEIAAARDYLEKADKLSATPDAAISNNLGNLYFLEKKFAKAAEYYQRAAQADQKDANILVNLALAFRKAGKAEQAREAFRKAVSIDAAIPDKYRALFLELGEGI